MWQLCASCKSFVFNSFQRICPDEVCIYWDSAQKTFPTMPDCFVFYTYPTNIDNRGSHIPGSLFVSLRNAVTQALSCVHEEIWPWRCWNSPWCCWNHSWISTAVCGWGLCHLSANWGNKASKAAHLGLWKTLHITSPLLSTLQSYNQTQYLAWGGHRCASL